MAQKENQAQKDTTIFYDGEGGGYSSKELFMSGAGIYSITQAQKRYLLKSFPESFCEPESPKAKRILAKQKELAEVKAGEKVRDNPPPWGEAKESQAASEKNEGSAEAEE